MSSKSYQGGKLEGLGGTVEMDPYHLDGIDPTLDSCCQREVSDTPKKQCICLIIVGVLIHCALYQ